MIYLKRDIEESISILKQRFYLIKNSNFILSKDLDFKTSLQSIFDPQFLMGAQTRAVAEVILAHTINVEKKLPGQGLRFINDVFEKKYDAFVQAQSLSRRATLSDVCNIIESVDLDTKIKDAIKEAIDLSGFNGRILVEKSANDTIIVERTSGYNFSCETPSVENRFSIKDCKVALVDGYIESVQEINLFLEEASASKSQILLISRGFHPDVLYTLKVNFERKSLFVIPVVSKFDVAGINMIRDLSVVTGCDPITSDKGQIISSLRVSSLKSIDKCIVDRGHISLFNEQMGESVKKHVQSLKEKRESADSLEKQSLFTDRIKSLTSGCVIVKIPDQPTYKVIVEKIDFLLRSIGSLIGHGVLHTSNNNFYRQSVAKCTKQIDDIGAIITNE